MTPAEVREVLLEEARWWANQPDHSGTAHDRIEVLEQLADDDRMLVMLCDMYQDANAFRDRHRDVQIYPFSVWNMTALFSTRVHAKVASEALGHSWVSFTMDT